MSERPKISDQCDIARQLRWRVEALAMDRHYLEGRIAGIRRRVPTCGNPPIHPTPEA